MAAACRLNRCAIRCDIDANAVFAEAALRRKTGLVSQIEIIVGRIDRMLAVFEYLFGKSRASVRAAVRLWLLRAVFSRGVRLYRCGMEPRWSTSEPKDRRIDITG